MKDDKMVRFLILRFGSASEVLMTTPVIRCLKEQVEGASIDYVVGRAWVHLLEHNPYLNKVHVLEGLKGKQVKKIKEEGFDYIIDLQRDVRSEMIRARLQLISFAIPKHAFRYWMKVRLGIGHLPENNWVERCLETIQIFDVVNDSKGLDYIIPDHDEVSLSQLPQPFRKGFVTYVMGAKYRTRKLPADMISEICRGIGYPVVLIGGPEEANEAEIVSRASGTNVWNGCGIYTFGQSASLVRQSRLVLTHDTGMMHVASSFGRPVISIWGNTIPGFGMAPYRPHKDSRIFEVKDLSCRPCSLKGYNTCPKRHFHCMRHIDLEKLVQHASHILGTV